MATETDRKSRFARPAPTRRRRAARHRPLVRLARRIGRFLLLFSALVALTGLAGAWVPFLDPVNAAAPLVPVLVCAGGVLALVGRGLSPAFALVALGGGGIAVSRLWPEYRLEVPSAGTAPGRDIVLLSYNVRHDNPDPEGTVRAIRASGADVVLLQESGAAFRPYIVQLRSLYPYGGECRGGRPCNLIVLSRFPMGKERFRLRDDSGRPFGPPLVQARIEPPGLHPFTVATVHIPRPTIAAHGPARPGADGGVARLGAALRAVGDPGFVLAGDFNAVPWSFALQRVDRLVAPLTRATRALPTYPGSGPVPPLLPIDHVYVGPAWLVRSVQRLPAGASDHRGVRVVLHPVG